MSSSRRGEKKTDFKPYNDYIKKYSQNNNLKIHNEKQKNKKNIRSQIR